MYWENGYKIRAKTQKLIENSDEMFKMYMDGVPLEDILTKFPMTEYLFHRIRKLKGIERRKKRAKYRWKLNFKEIEIPKYMKDTLSDGTLYKILGGHCDYLLMDMKKEKFTLIEEKKSIQAISLFKGITQLILAEKKLRQEKNIIIDNKILYARYDKLKSSGEQKADYLKNVIEDAEKYLNIIVIIQARIPIWPQNTSVKS